MTTKAFDPKASYAAVKAREGMIAFVGFSLPFDDREEPREGFMKISAGKRAYRGDMLTLTLMMDTEGDTTLKTEIQKRFGKITFDSVKARIGSDLENLSKISLDHLGEIEEWYIEEIRIGFKTADKQQKTLIEQDVIPALEDLLPSRFSPVEWWPSDEDKQNGPIPKWSSSGFGPFISFFKGWFSPAS